MGWFNWMDNLSLWAQMAIGIVIGTGLVTIITFCIVGIKAIIEHLIDLYKNDNVP